MKIRTLSASAMLLAGLACGQAWAQVTVIPQSALIASTEYYTEMAGLNLGSEISMTGGGNGLETISGPRNDDGFSYFAFNFSTPLSFFGASYTGFYANNNGNISFNNGIAAYTPIGPQGQNVPIISPYFADADTRNLNSGVMHLNQDIANQTIVTWDQVGYYDSHADLLNSFQLVVRSSDYVVPVGEGTIGFFWKTMGWETGDSSGGYGGFSQPFGNGQGAPAVGFGNGTGDGMTPYGGSGMVLDGTQIDGISTVVQDHHIWFYVNGQGVPVVVEDTPAVPEPETYAMLLAGLGLLGFTTRRRKQNV